MLREIRAIPGYPGYSATSVGGIWSGGRRLKPWKTNGGHLRVALYREGKRHVRYIHHLILETFVGPRPEGLECCHKDDNKENNATTNLRWDTPTSNRVDARRNDVRARARQMRRTTV